MPGFDTAATIISDVAMEVGLVTSAIDDPFSSTNQNIVQLVALLKPTGRMLVKAHPWTHLTASGTIDADGSLYYTLDTYVEDFDRFIDGTTWDIDSSESIAAATPQEWSATQPMGVGSVRRTMRVIGVDLHFYPVPTSGQIRFEYISRNWGAESFTKPVPTAADDVIQFDAHLFSRALILRWLTAKGMNTAAALDDYNEALRAAIGQDGAAPTLSLNARRMPWPNVPETGFGQ